MQLEQGDLLIAPAQMSDPRFRKTVMLLCQQGQMGHMALCLNKPTEFTIDHVLEQAEIQVSQSLDHTLYWGGPVNPQTIWMLHPPEWAMSNTLMINEQWAMTSTELMFHRLAEGDRPSWFRCFFGFAAWSPGQLENELSGVAPWRPEHSWLVAHQCQPEFIVDQSEDDLWPSAIQLSAGQAVDEWL